MTFYIRNGNEVYAGRRENIATNQIDFKWSKIDENTKQLQVIAFTTRNDAQQFLKSLDGVILVTEFLGAKIENNLDYE